MSEHLLKILLDELKTVRLKCVACGGVIEVEVVSLDADSVADIGCPMCKKPFFPSHMTETPLRLLARAIEDMRAHSRVIGVEFVLKVND